MDYKENLDPNSIRFTGVQPEDTFNILIATDIHLGYDETNPETGNDSFNTFEEILMLANSRDVDFILLAGDLFHKAQPTANTLNKCIQLLRTYTMGQKQLQFQIKDTATGEAIVPGSKKENNSNLSATTAPVNYLDDNLNISYPVFTIHGNHDDVVNNLSAIDVLTSTGLVNYFGKWENLTEIELQPIIFSKGMTSIALYGLSHIPDRRLYNLFDHNKVHAQYVGDGTNFNKEFFNLMAIHQNRAERGRNNHISVNVLPAFMDLVVWGHEHDCRIHPEQYNEMYVTQPGSSVATSLCEGEAIEKHIGILKVSYNHMSHVEGKPKFCLTPVKLKTVRPLIFKSIELSDYEQELYKKGAKVTEQVEKVLSATVFEMLKEAKVLFTNHPRQPRKPLLRLRVSYDNVDYIINTRRFGQKFSDYVAKSDEILLFKKNVHRMKLEQPNIDEELLLQQANQRDDKDRVEDYVDDYFGKVTDESEKLSLFDFRCLTDVVRLIVDKDDHEGAEKIIEAQVEAAMEYFKANSQGPEDIIDLTLSFRDNKSKEVHDKIVESMCIKKREPSTQSSAAAGTIPSAAVKVPRASTSKKAASLYKDESSDDDYVTKTKPPNESAARKSSSSDIEVDEASFRKPSKRQTTLSASTAQPKRGRGSRGGATAAAASTSTRGKGKSAAASTTAARGRPKKNQQPSLSTAEQLSQTRTRRAAKEPAATSTQKTFDEHAFVISSDED